MNARALQQEIKNKKNLGLIQINEMLILIKYKI
jgi:hypothetical protein